MHWRRKWQPTPVFLPGESKGRQPGGPPSMGSHRVRHDWCDLATATWISHGFTCVPDPEPHSYLPPNPIPQGCPSAPALSVLFHTSDLVWWSISHMAIYVFQCYSLKSSHLRLLPQSPKVFISVSLLLSCTQGYCYHLSKFNIYVLIYCIGVFLSDLLHSV